MMFLAAETKDQEILDIIKIWEKLSAINKIILLIVLKHFTQEKRGSSAEADRYTLTSQIRKTTVSTPALEYARGPQFLEPSFPKSEKN